MKKVLITGAQSYIGTAVEQWLAKTGNYTVETVDLKQVRPDEIDFSGIDTVFHVAGIAHIKENRENAPLYDQVNHILAVNTARAAKTGGVKQLILMSSMSVYGLESGVITKESRPAPKTHYGKSKYEADTAIEKMRGPAFRVCILRPPMVYGNGCPGNYQRLRKLALKMPLFPGRQNRRSMIYIENLCGFVESLIEQERDGLFFPQNPEYVCTAEMVKYIAQAHHKKISFTGIFNPLLKLGFPSVVEKVFGDLIYDCPSDRSAVVESLEETIERTEGIRAVQDD